MTTTKQDKTNNYVAELSRNACASIHNKDVLDDVNKCIMLYKENIITKQQLTAIYKNAMKQTKYEVKIKQMQIESEYYSEVFKRAFSKICSKVQHMPISENDTVTTEEPNDTIITYEYIDIDDNDTIYEYIQDTRGREHGPHELCPRVHETVIIFTNIRMKQLIHLMIQLTMLYMIMLK